MWYSSLLERVCGLKQRRHGRFRFRRLELESLEDRQLLDAAGSVTWFMGEVPPGDVLSHAAPTTEDTIRFTLNDALHGNPCLAEAAHGGVPVLVFDAAARTIDVAFQGPASEFCLLIYNPVSGFQGELSGLDAGAWTLRGPESSLTFTVYDRYVFLPVETIVQGQVSYVQYGEPGFTGLDVVIQNQESWQEFWTRHTSGLFPQPALPDIDFESQMVIVAIMGYQSSGGPSTSITGVFLDSTDGTLHVGVADNREPGFLTVITNPYHIVVVPVVSFVSVSFDHYDV